MGRTIVFHRDYDRYSGGHQKVFDYFGHMLAHGAWIPSIYFASHPATPDSSVWSEYTDLRVDTYDPPAYHAVFLAGVDWRAYLPFRSGNKQPVLNLIQHVRHGDPASDVYPFLRERAIRICVSPEVTSAIVGSGIVNGPVYTIQNGTDLNVLRAYRELSRTHDVYILGNKQPLLAQQLAASLREMSYAVLVHTDHTERSEVLNAMATSRVSLLLPNETEGFYLPALEAMSLSDMVVVPDCVGNRSFCHHRVNCLMPSLDARGLIEAVERAFSFIGSGEALAIQSSARNTVAHHSLERERKEFFEILENLSQIW